MPFYINAQALLADIRLRLEGLGPTSTALVVEGPDDKRLFYHRASPSATIVVAGGKTLLRAGLASIIKSDSGRILFLTDCDYDVRRGDLTGGPNVVITHGCDVESDLIELGLLAQLAVEVTPRALEGDGNASRVADSVYDHALRMSIALGRVRMAAQPLGIDLGLDELDLAKIWDKESDAIMTDKLEYITWARLKPSGISREEWHALIEATPTDALMCNGKDLVRATQLFFRKLYRMSNGITCEILTTMLRLAVNEEQFERWSVVSRIHKWEARYGRKLLMN